MFVMFEPGLQTLYLGSYSETKPKSFGKYN